MFFRNESFKDFTRFYPVVTVIVGIQLIIWLITFFDNPLGDLIFQWGVGFNPLIADGEYWRLITPVFLHSTADFMHVLFNSFSLVLFGPALEQMLGKWKFASIYLVAGIIGNLFTFLVDTSSIIPYLGASGAVYGLLGLYIYMVFFRPELIDPASKQVIMIFTVLGLIMTFIRPGIAISAHVFGFIGGVALGPIALTHARPFSPWRQQRRQVRPGQPNFNPNRWKRRRFRMNKNISSIIWWIILILALLGLFGGLIL